jgi:hypothetical protein
VEAEHRRKRQWRRERLFWGFFFLLSVMEKVIASYEVT